MRDLKLPVLNNGNFLPHQKVSNPFGFFTPEDGIDRLSRNVGKKLSLLAA
jgi:hypothetical protein